ncbi:MAG: universal stress protein [Myxococcota bacterium]
MVALMVVCTDFSPCSEEALPRAAELAKLDDARVLLVNVSHQSVKHGVPAAGWDEGARRKLLAARRKYFGGLSDNEVQYDVLPGGDSAAAICDVARKNGASLIVMGSHGRTGVVRQLLGSVAENVVRHAPCSVMVVRSSSD